MMSSFYGAPSYQGGGSYPVFVGGRRQVGGGVLGSLSRLFVPTLKKVGVPILKTVGKRALGLGANVVADALQGENFGESLKTRAKQSALDVLNDLTTPKRSSRRRKRRRGVHQIGSG